MFHALESWISRAAVQSRSTAGNAHPGLFYQARMNRRAAGVRLDYKTYRGSVALGCCPGLNDGAERLTQILCIYFGSSEELIVLVLQGDLFQQEGFGESEHTPALAIGYHPLSN